MHLIKSFVIANNAIVYQTTNATTNIGVDDKPQTNKQTHKLIKA